MRWDGLVLVCRHGPLRTPALISTLVQPARPVSLRRPSPCPPLAPLPGCTPYTPRVLLSSGPLSMPHTIYPRSAIHASPSSTAGTAAVEPHHTLLSSTAGRGQPLLGSRPSLPAFLTPPSPPRPFPSRIPHSHHIPFLLSHRGCRDIGRRRHQGRDHLRAPRAVQRREPLPHTNKSPPGRAEQQGRPGRAEQQGTPGRAWPLRKPHPSKTFNVLPGPRPCGCRSARTCKEKGRGGRAGGHWWGRAGRAAARHTARRGPVVPGPSFRVGPMVNNGPGSCRWVWLAGPFPG